MASKKRKGNDLPQHPNPAIPSPERHKHRILSQAVPSSTSSIAQALSIKDEELFLLTDPNGNVPLRRNHGFGLYYHDCRFLNGYVLSFGGEAPQLLSANPAFGYLVDMQLTNAGINAEPRPIPAESVACDWRRVVDQDGLVLSEQFCFRNFGSEDVVLPLEFAFQSDFDDVFAVRGLVHPPRHGHCPPRWHGSVLNFSHDGDDRVRRSVAISFSERPIQRDGNQVAFRLPIPARGETSFQIALELAETALDVTAPPHRRYFVDVEGHAKRLRAESEAWQRARAHIGTDRIPPNRVIDRALGDLHMLQDELDGRCFYSAGIPWFCTLFGRDSILSALMTLSSDDSVAAETLRLLACYQGDKVDPWRDEAPGKILHELRVGELARSGQIPHTPYYGSVDVTPLFLILVGRHAAWTGSLELFNELRAPIERALTWIDCYGMDEDSGFLVYRSHGDTALINQGWKDSGDGIVDEHGAIAEPPIALVEVQGYVYMAWRLMADLYERLGDTLRAQELQSKAQALKERFNRDFWLPDKGFYALCLQAGGRPSKVISSNPGQALWTGIVDDDKARLVAERLMADDIFSGWGVRTLSSQEIRYNPLGYHLGTVWPHDNALIAAGLRHYGFDREAGRILHGILDAATSFNHGRLPELFAGFAREPHRVPVPYPVACHPQAWAAASVVFLVETILGLVPDGFQRQLRIVRPMLPDTVDRLDLRGMRLAGGMVDLRFLRSTDGIAVEVLSTKGRIDVVLETETPFDQGRAA